ARRRGPLSSPAKDKASAASQCYAQDRAATAGVLTRPLLYGRRHSFVAHRSGLAAVSWAGWSRAFLSSRPPDRVERIKEHRVESTGAGTRLVVTRCRRWESVADDGDAGWPGEFAATLVVRCDHRSPVD